MPVLEPQFALDLVFWLALSLALVKALFHLAVPYLVRELKMYQSR